MFGLKFCIRHFNIYKKTEECIYCALETANK